MLETKILLRVHLYAHIYTLKKMSNLWLYFNRCFFFFSFFFPSSLGVVYILFFYGLDFLVMHFIAARFKVIRLTTVI